MELHKALLSISEMHTTRINIANIKMILSEFDRECDILKNTHGKNDSRAQEKLKFPTEKNHDHVDFAPTEPFGRFDV